MQRKLTSVVSMFSIGPIRIVVLLVVGALVSTGVPLSAKTRLRMITDVRTEVETWRERTGLVDVELSDDSRARGQVGLVGNTVFDVGNRQVGYEQVAAFFDPITGVPVASVQQRPPVGGNTGMHVSPKVLVIIGVAVAAFFLVIDHLYGGT